MPAIQTTDRINFGTARLFEFQPGGYPIPVANLTDVSADFKADLKEAYGETSYPIAVADGHRSIDISAKHYTLNPTILSDALGGTISSGTSPMALDEAHTVPSTTPYTVTLTNGATYVANSLIVVGFPLTGAIAVPTIYSIVASGSEVAGKSCSVSALGVITFATADAGINVQCSYQYTSTSGTRVTVTNPFQNSSKTYQLVAVKRDLSPLDNSTAYLIVTFFAARTAGIKNEYKEGDFTVYERTYKAYANSAGNVAQADFVNV